MSVSSNLDPKPSTAGYWYGSELVDDDWQMQFTSAALSELNRALEVEAKAGQPALSSMPALITQMNDIKATLFQSPGFAVVRGLPFNEWDLQRTRNAVKLLAHLMGAPTEQTYDGTTLYEVADHGLRVEDGARRSRTNLAQPFHSDAPWIRQPPWIVGLYCLRAAAHGGQSQCLSFRAMISDLIQEHPEMAEHLSNDVIWHRQLEHAKDDTPVSRHPIVWQDEAGRWCGRFYSDYIAKGYACANEVLDDATRELIGHLERMSNEEHRQARFKLETGDIAWFNNRWCLHSRSGFEMTINNEPARLLTRVWHRLPGDEVGLDT